MQCNCCHKRLHKFNEKLFAALHMKILLVACENCVCVCECVCESVLAKANSSNWKQSHTHTRTQIKLSKQHRKHVAQIFSAGAGRATCRGHLWDNCSKETAGGQGRCRGGGAVDRQLGTGNWTWDMAITAHATWRNKYRRKRTTQKGK